MSSEIHRPPCCQDLPKRRPKDLLIFGPADVVSYDVEVKPLAAWGWVSFSSFSSQLVGGQALLEAACTQRLRLQVGAVGKVRLHLWTWEKCKIVDHFILTNNHFRILVRLYEPPTFYSFMKKAFKQHSEWIPCAQAFKLKPMKRAEKRRAARRSFW